jgi:uncharacterized protein YqgV (UPF0045/DUF77 family)
MANALLSIQILPKTPNGEDVIPYVDRAISVIDRSGVKYFVSPLETTMEGDLTQLLAIVEEMNHEMIAADGASMDKLTEKYR